jgi:phospholipid/cholesterol/gamma-HCH transport system substrate-binding protein
MASSRKQEIGVGLLVLTAMAVLAFMSIKVGALRNVGDEIQLKVTLSDAAGLSDGAAVRIAGVQVGQIQQMGVVHDRAVLEIAVAKSANVRQDADVQVRARSILGEKYLEITPMSDDAPLFEDGATMAVTRPQTEIDELVNSLGPLVNAVDADAVNAAMERLSAALEDDPERVARMLKDVETIIGNGAKASGSLDALVSETRATLSSVRQISADARPMIQKTSRVIGRVDEATENLPAITADVEAAVADARQMVADSKAILKRVERSTDSIETVLANLSEIDKWELRRLLREEGILVRFKENQVEETD